MASDYYDIVKYPLSTEKAIGMLKSSNGLMFVVDKNATKKEIKIAIEGVFKKKVKYVNTKLHIDGRKIAYIIFPQDTNAMDIATQLGIM